MTIRDWQKEVYPLDGSYPSRGNTNSAYDSPGYQSTMSSSMAGDYGGRRIVRAHFFAQTRSRHRASVVTCRSLSKRRFGAREVDISCRWHEPSRAHPILQPKYNHQSKLSSMVLGGNINDFRTVRGSPASNNASSSVDGGIDVSNDMVWVMGTLVKTKRTRDMEVHD